MLQPGPRRQYLWASAPRPLQKTAFSRLASPQITLKPFRGSRCTIVVGLSIVVVFRFSDPLPQRLNGPMVWISNSPPRPLQATRDRSFGGCNFHSPVQRPAVGGGVIGNRPGGAKTLGRQAAGIHAVRLQP
jgi:hypothetical protein